MQVLGVVAARRTAQAGKTFTVRVHGQRGDGRGPAGQLAGLIGVQGQAVHFLLPAHRLLLRLRADVQHARGVRPPHVVADLQVRTPPDPRLAALEVVQVEAGGPLRQHAAPVETVAHVGHDPHLAAFVPAVLLVAAAQEAEVAAVGAESGAAHPLAEGRELFRFSPAQRQQVHLCLARSSAAAVAEKSQRLAIRCPERSRIAPLAGRQVAGRAAV